MRVATGCNRLLDAREDAPLYQCFGTFEGLLFWLKDEDNRSVQGRAVFSQRFSQTQGYGDMDIVPAGMLRACLGARRATRPSHKYRSQDVFHGESDQK